MDLFKQQLHILSKLSLFFVKHQCQIGEEKSDRSYVMSSVVSLYGRMASHFPNRFAIIARVSHLQSRAQRLK